MKGLCPHLIRFVIATVAIALPLSQARADSRDLVTIKYSLDPFRTYEIVGITKTGLDLGSLVDALKTHQSKHPSAEYELVANVKCNDAEVRKIVSAVTGTGAVLKHYWAPISAWSPDEVPYPGHIDLLKHSDNKSGEPGAPVDPLTKAQAISKAEEFVLTNGYTAASSDKIKAQLDHESIEWADNPAEILKTRFNTLKPGAIGVRRGAKGNDGWSVAFDYFLPPKGRESAVCRVVTMKQDGSNIRVEHVDGFRDFFEGFSKE